MADIDFDELDKAVNDLMANVDASKRPAGLDEPEEKIVDIPTSAPVAAAPTTPAPTSPAPVTVPTPAAPAPTPAANPSLAVKRRGQFMDIMHPARDMNPTKPVSRQGATIQPGNDMVAASATQQNDTVPTSASSQADAPASSWPDPIDMANAGTGIQSPQAAPAAATLSSESSLESAGEAPLTSPFLPDAKPEKRPLGDPLQSDDTTQGTPEPSSADASTATPANPETPPPAILPEEFSGDLMAVESRDLSSHPDAQPVAAPSAPEQPKLEAGEEEALIPAVATPDPIEQPKTSVQQTEPQTQLPAGGSIAQQYAEQPSSGDQSNGSIYDTSAYHQPIEPVAPVKKKTPTSVWIMIGVGLLLVGAIGGAAFFYFTR